jgi:L-alanine-DL-glutamate epimerase-like enolase superfamily enzyme
LFVNDWGRPRTIYLNESLLGSTESGKNPAIPSRQSHLPTADQQPADMLGALHLPLERITAVCNARPDAEIVVDVNQGWSFSQLVELAPHFKALDVTMIEQPLPQGEDDVLEGYQSPITLCADESCLDTSELEQASRRYQMVNIKLDKTGGLTEALNLARRAKEKGMTLMVGKMVGTSLAMAPAYVIAQLCDFVDLDGALFLAGDRSYPMSYEQGVVTGLQSRLWG